MQVTKLDIPDVIMLEPDVFCDKRGFFFESFNQCSFNKAVGREVNFVQDNHSRSTMGVIRGLHYQIPPMAQGKLVRVVKGEVFDVAVDIRKGSQTFGRWVGQILTGENKRQLWIPEGFAHGFVTLSETAEFLYKTSNYYSPELERCIRWDDPQLAIEWNYSGDVHVSDKDTQGKSFDSAEVFFAKDGSAE